jgi:hypothetical protein
MISPDFRFWSSHRLLGSYVSQQVEAVENVGEALLRGGQQGPDFARAVVHERGGRGLIYLWPFMALARCPVYWTK